MIVICAWCRKQYREFGEKEWRPIADRPVSENKASHGMCPACFGDEVDTITSTYGDKALRACTISK